MRQRVAFTTIELMIVFVIFGIITLFAMPKMNDMRERAKVSSARNQLTASIAAARSAAIRSGTSTSFWVSGDLVWVSQVDSSGTTVTLIEPVDLHAQYGVSISDPGDYGGTVTYNARGIASLAGNSKYTLVRGTREDSVCVSRLGAVMRNCL